LFEDFKLFLHGGNPVGGFSAGFQKKPAFVVYSFEKPEQLLVGIIPDIQFTNMDSVSQPLPYHVEVPLKSGRKEILIIAVPAYLHRRLGNMVKDSFHVRQLLGLISVDFNPYQLTVFTGEFTHLVQGDTDLLDGFLLWHRCRQIIWFHLDAGGSYIVAKFYILLCLVNVVSQDSRIGTVIFEIGPVANAFHGAVGESLFNISALLGSKVGLNLVSMTRAKFHTEISGLFAV